MRRPALLTLLWALFAAAAVGVGFGAAGLVGNPFTDAVGDTLAGQASTTPAATASSGTAATSRSLTTRGGVVSASCAAGLVTMGGSPAVGWSLDRIDQGRLPVASLELKSSGQDGKVEVSARCVGGVPRFAMGDGSGTSGGSVGGATPSTSETGDDHGGGSGGSGDDGSGSGSGESSGSDGGSGGGRGRG